MEVSKWCLEIHRGGITVYIMSNIVVFLVKDKLSYEKSLMISNKIVSFCLNKNVGAIFNFLGYRETLIHEADPTLYFSISDDFLQLNSEYLSTAEIENIECDNGKKEFYEKFSFLDEIHNVLVEFELKNISLIISSDGSIEKISDLEIVASKTRTITEILYNIIVDNHEKYGCDFPDIVINFN